MVSQVFARARGDHLIFVGEVEQYKYNDGEPLVFHSGRYRIATRHPDIAD
ncbi:MAG: hypothetical protein DMG69_27920 [Acidobacteria bacterium]|nr:MAG: hypothetical protein DMG69_27920 [Acidobacteriota bacterium]